MRAQLKNTAREKKREWNSGTQCDARQILCHLQCLARNSFSSMLPTIQWMMQKSQINQQWPNQVQHNRKMDAVDSIECHCLHQLNVIKESVPSQWIVKNQQTIASNRKPAMTKYSRNQQFVFGIFWWFAFLRLIPLMPNYWIPIWVYNWKSERISSCLNVNTITTHTSAHAHTQSERQRERWRTSQFNLFNTPVQFSCTK